MLMGVGTSIRLQGRDAQRTGSSQDHQAQVCPPVCSVGPGPAAGVQGCLLHGRECPNLISPNYPLPQFSLVPQDCFLCLHTFKNILYCQVANMWCIGCAFGFWSTFP